MCTVTEKLRPLNRSGSVELFENDRLAGSRRLSPEQRRDEIAISLIIERGISPRPATDWASRCLFSHEAAVMPTADEVCI